MQPPEMAPTSRVKGRYSRPRTPTARTQEKHVAAITAQRPRTCGKFLYAGDEKLYVRGATYGTFRPSEAGCEFPDAETVRSDFALMAANGMNALRTYTVPPRWLLDSALAHGLRVMVGIPVERYIGYLSDRKKDAPDISELVRAGVLACAGHPACLCYAIGNEIPGPIARWHDRTRVTRFLERLYRTAKLADPEALVTYVNYPSTEYLDLPFLDLVCFNVFLESKGSYDAYLARLQTIAGERPVMMTEIGLDSLRNGETAQARTLAWQVQSTFAAGFAGAFVYSWTDEWFRGGEEVHDWKFGLTSRDRVPKPALATVSGAFRDLPFNGKLDWPRFSVIVCSYNGARTIRESLEALERLEYPDYEVIVVDDGSTDGVSEIAREYTCKVIRTENRGLGNARNTGLEAASGELVAYLDDDAYPDPHWLQYLAATFLRTDFAAVGGPNISPPNASYLAQCVANAPGNPTHVLLTDEQAEHIPGCNMAFRKSCLEAIGGFDPQFRVAGDDIDVCWRLEQRGWKLGFSAAAMVWHHRRDSVRAFWKQQFGYGRAEAYVERKWPEKYGVAGQIAWGGRLYGRGLARALEWRRSRIYHGTWGTAPYQSLYEPAPGHLGWLVAMPEWYLVIAGLAGLSLLGLAWPPLKLSLLPLGVAVLATVAQATVGAARADFPDAPPNRLLRFKLRLVTAGLRILQPLARLGGRMTAGLTPWRRSLERGLALPRSRSYAVWSEEWQAMEERLKESEAALRGEGWCVRRGGAFDRWDLEVRGGSFGASRLLMAVEEHGRGRQLVRVRIWPKPFFGGIAATAILLVLSAAAVWDRAWLAGGLLGAAGAFVAIRTMVDVAAASAAFRGLLD